MRRREVRDHQQHRSIHACEPPWTGMPVDVCFNECTQRLWVSTYGTFQTYIMNLKVSVKSVLTCPAMAPGSETAVSGSTSAARETQS